MIEIRRFGLALMAALGWLGAPPADAASWLEKNFWMSGPLYDLAVPACEDPWVLGKVMSRFAEKERAFWQSSLFIVEIDRVRETAFRPWRGAPNAIPRRYCSGVAMVSDQRPRPIYYWIGEDLGMIGASWGVEWCVVGLDRNWAYNPSCRMAQP
jgi:hypothetical protein